MDLRTERLTLRPSRLADLEALHELWTDPEVRRFLFDDRRICRDEAREILERSETTFQEAGFGVWLAYRAECEAPTGFAGLLAPDSAAPHLVVGIRPACWGQGLATEAARAVLDHAFAALGLPEVAADVDEPNLRSIRVLEKLGMTLQGRAVVNGHPLLCYGWRRRRRTGARFNGRRARGEGARLG